MPNDKKIKREIDLTQDPIDLTGDDKEEVLNSSNTTSSNSNSNSSSSSNLPSVSSSLSIFSSSSGSDTDIDMLADIFMNKIKIFLSTTRNFLDEKIISQMIFEIAEDSFIKNMIHLRASLYETAVAFDNQNAITVLREFRLHHLLKLLNSQRFQASPEMRDRSNEEIFAEIDENNAESTLEKYDALGAAAFLEDFFSDYVTELSVSHGDYAADILKRTAYQIGTAFADRKITVPQGKRNVLAAIFIGFAAEQGYQPASEWTELRGKSQASRQAPGSSSS